MPQGRPWIAWCLAGFRKPKSALMTTNQIIRTARRPFFALASVALVAVPSIAGTAAHAERRLSPRVFNDQFAGYAALPPAPVPAGPAVDLRTVSPTVEARARTATIPDTTPGNATAEGRLIGAGGASYYADRFHGRRTASGEAFNKHALTAAHRTLPFGTRVQVTNPTNGRSVVVRINDRGPFHGGRVIDLSRSAAERIGIVARGHGQVRLSIID